MIYRSKAKQIINDYVLIFFIVAVIVIISFVIFKYPQMGVADQGDFNRIMSETGLTVLDSDNENIDFVRYYDYLVTDYKINTDSYFMTLLLGRSSMNYIIIFIGLVCSVFGKEVFRTQYLAIFYATIYIFSFTSILKLINIKGKINYMLISLLVIFVFFDGNYLIWFNSLYGEPMMIISLTLYIASVFYYINGKYINKGNNIQRRIMYIYISSIILLISKFQLITSLPILVFLLIKITYQNRRLINKKYSVIYCILFSLIIASSIKSCMINSDVSMDTQYNSVFYGILNGSEHPRQDLIDLGLNPDMAVEAGKNMYLDKDKYQKYEPYAEITQKEFYDKISNYKLAKFYLTHPSRLFDGMQYTAEKAFKTSTSLGKCYISDSITPVTEQYNRFTLWSEIREKWFPKNLLFIVIVYFFVFAVSLLYFIRNRKNGEITDKITVLWIVMLIGIIQFPMPFIGNGQADTSKQLFLFNYIFDILIVVAVGCIICKILFFINKEIRVKLRSE